MKKTFIFTVMFVFMSLMPLYAAEKMIGAIMTGDITHYNTLHRAFVDELKKQGFGAGKVQIVVQKPSPTSMAWTNAARKLVAVDANIIVTYGAPPTLSVMKETSKIPIVFVGVPDPAALGISAKNITGISSKVPIAGLIKNLKSFSNFSKLGIIYNSSEKDTVKQAEEVEKLGAKFGFKSVRYDLKKISGAVKLTDVNALFITTSSVAMKSIDTIIKQARAAKIPTAAVIGGAEASGILLTFCPDPRVQGKEAAKIVSAIIKGKKPSAIPAKDSGKIEMVINLKEAKALGFNIPLDLLMSATRVIK
ncbi:MAG: ABC transporter substrate-binding protein [Deltaproteobacteria bacterium]|nr:ABC transporter substrate-binding protein [Deltaproteobacteria bacterium]